MKIEKLGAPTTVLSNPFSHNGYFGWPSIAKLQNGRIAVVSSGFRIGHVCPFGKAVMAISEDNGEHYSLPMVVIDTPLDDRDAGILAFDQTGVLVTSFNNTVEMQRNIASNINNPYVQGYLDTVTSEDEKKYIGATFRISHDCGVTFGDIYISPITSPHGPTQLRDGTVLWVGRTFSDDDKFAENNGILAYRINTEDGTMQYVGRIPATYKNGVLVNSCEPHTIELEDGTLLCHFRGEGGGKLFTTYQSFSYDQGKTWTEPEQLLDDFGGAPAHLLRHSSGILISAYGYRRLPFGIRAMFSKDNGKTWEKDIPIFEDGVTGDLGYPATIELEDHTLLTVFYGPGDDSVPNRILQQKWRIAK